jgi:hypothetical protein
MLFQISTFCQHLLAASILQTKLFDKENLIIRNGHPFNLVDAFLIILISGPAFMSYHPVY